MSGDDLPDELELALIPRPMQVELRRGDYMVGPETGIAASVAAGGIARYAQEELSRVTGLPLELRSRARLGDISLVVNRKMNRLGLEGYRIQIASDGAKIEGHSTAGLFNGYQTFRQLFSPNIYRRAPMPGVWRVPCLRIEDEPRFPWRGMQLDVARYFMPKEFILKYIDLLAIHKFNVLHLHLTDDQGWRVQIDKYPLLTEVGSWRKESMKGHYDDQQWDGKPHGGFYTKDDLREIVSYAQQRFINVVPEIEMPGHAQAAIAAYPHLGNTGQSIEVRSSWGISDHVYSVSPECLQFQKDVLTEVMEIFPSPYIHIGGDECPKTEWKASAAAQAHMTQHGLKDEEELQSWFIRQIDGFLTSQGRRLLGWDEILEGGLAPGATVMSWRGEDGGVAAAKAGHDVVMTPWSHTYFNYYQSENKQEEPVAIGGCLPLQKVYEYEPVPAELTAREARFVLGSQGQVWTEHISTPKHVEYMAFPRACALAEVLWTAPALKDYDHFYERLETHLHRLKILDVAYRDPSRPYPWLAIAGIYREKP